MDTTFLDEVQKAIKNWWVSLVLGILFIGVSLLLMFKPMEGYGALVVVFSICMFMSGILEIVFAVSNREALSGWGWYLTGGIIDLILGIFLMASPLMTAMLIPYVLAFWIMFRGFSAIGFAMELQHAGVRSWGWYLVFGILPVICSIIIIWYPAVGAVTSIYIVAFAFMFMGFFRIMMAFELRDLHKNSTGLKERLSKIKDIK